MFVINTTNNYYCYFICDTSYCYAFILKV